MIAMQRHGNMNFVKGGPRMEFTAENFLHDLTHPGGPVYT
jgi:hypothetical protein